MKKPVLSFRAIRAGSYLHRFFLGDIKRRVRNVAAVIAASLFISVGAEAQCNTFQNADEANPLLSVLDHTKKVAGFAFADIDGDGDQDVYVSYDKRTYPKQVDTLHFFRNTGTKNHPTFKEDTNTGFGNQLAGYQNQFSQFVDIDGDGDLDFFTSSDAQNYYAAGYVLFYKNEGTSVKPKFVLSSDNPVSFAANSIAQPFQFADVDGDGDLDFYMCDVSPAYGFGYYQRICYNKGTSQNPVFNYNDYKLNTIDENLGRTYYDWNKDGLLDFFGINIYSPAATEYIKNTGPKSNPHYVNAKAEGPVFTNGAPYRMIDLNNDGAPEVFSIDAHYSTLAPVAVIKDTVISRGGKQATILNSKNLGPGYSFRWEYNGKTIAGANRSYLIPKQPGTYTLYVTDSCGTGVSLNYELKNNASLLLADDKIGNVTKNSVGIKAYPNPFVNTITLQLPGSLCTVKITDIAGRVLLSQATSAATFQTGEKLKAGTYLVQVWQGKEVIYKSTLVKQ